LPRLPRPTQLSDKAPSPFDSLIDDGSQPAEQATPAPTDNKAAAADGSQAPTKTNDCKVPVANDAAPAAKPDDDASVEKPDGDKPACDTKVAADAKLVDGVTTGDSSKPESDDKAADGQNTDKPATQLQLRRRRRRRHYRRPCPIRAIKTAGSNKSRLLQNPGFS
jgi:hypothetical protein